MYFRGTRQLSNQQIYISISYLFREEEKAKEDLGAKQLAAMAAAEKLSSSKAAKAEPSPFAKIDLAAYSNKLVSFLARNFFTLKLIALIIAFTINFMLLFYKVSVVEEEGDGADEDLGPEIIDDGSGEEGKSKRFLTYYLKQRKKHQLILDL